MSLTVRAMRIAEAYLDDPGKFAAVDAKGRGIMAAINHPTLGVDPQFPANNYSMVTLAIRELEAINRQAGVPSSKLAPRAERAGRLLERRLTSITSPASSPASSPGNAAHGGGGTGPHPTAAAMFGEDACKGQKYRAAWKHALKSYANELNHRRKSGCLPTQWLGAGRIAAQTREMFDGLGPCGQTIVDAVKHGYSSPAKRGPETNMPDEVGDFLEEVVKGLRKFKAPFCVYTFSHLCLIS